MHLKCILGEKVLINSTSVFQMEVEEQEELFVVVPSSEEEDFFDMVYYYCGLIHPDCMLLLSEEQIAGGLANKMCECDKENDPCTPYNVINKHYTYVTDDESETDSE